MSHYVTKHKGATSKRRNKHNYRHTYPNGKALHFQKSTTNLITTKSQKIHVTFLKPVTSHCEK